MSTFCLRSRVSGVMYKNIHDIEPSTFADGLSGTALSSFGQWQNGQGVGNIKDKE